MHAFRELNTFSFLQISIQNVVNKEKVAFFFINDEELHLTFVISKSPKFSGMYATDEIQDQTGLCQPCSSV